MSDTIIKGKGSRISPNLAVSYLSFGVESASTAFFIISNSNIAAVASRILVIVSLIFSPPYAYIITHNRVKVNAKQKEINNNIYIYTTSKMKLFFIIERREVRIVKRTIYFGYNQTDYWKRWTAFCDHK